MNDNTLTFHVAGVQHRPPSDILDVCRELTDDAARPLPRPVQLVGEPGNPHDKYAVKVLVNGTHIGYVPKPLNIDVWALRDRGFKPVASLVEYAKDASPWLKFKVEIDFIKHTT